MADSLGSPPRPAAELGALYERGIRGFRSCLEILEHQVGAVRLGRSSAISELAGLEGLAIRESSAVERCIASLEPLVEGQEGGDDPHGLERLREEYRALRTLVLARNRRNRSLLEEELGHLRRLLAARRSRAGSPSPYLSAGEAALVDIRR